MRFWLRPLIGCLWLWMRLSILLVVGMLCIGVQVMVSVARYCYGQVRGQVQRRNLHLLRRSNVLYMKKKMYNKSYEIL